MPKLLFYKQYCICISLPVDHHDQQSSSLSSPHNESQQHSDHDKNSNAEPEVKSKPVEQESQSIIVAQESQLETVESKEEELPCSSPVDTATGIHVYDVHCVMWNHC